MPTLSLSERSDETAFFLDAAIALGNALDHYDKWLAPTCIMSDGPYGLGLFPGEAKTHHDLASWYAPHAAAWARLAMPATTL